MVCGCVVVVADVCDDFVWCVVVCGCVVMVCGVCVMVMVVACG